MNSFKAANWTKSSFQPLNVTIIKTLHFQSITGVTLISVDLNYCQLMSCCDHYSRKTKFHDCGKYFNAVAISNLFSAAESDTFRHFSGRQSSSKRFDHHHHITIMLRCAQAILSHLLLMLQQVSQMQQLWLLFSFLCLYFSHCAATYHLRWPRRKIFKHHKRFAVNFLQIPSHQPVMYRAIVQWIL